MQSKAIKAKQSNKSRAKQHQAKQCNARQRKAKKCKEMQSNAKQCTAEQSNAKQYKTKQSKAMNAFKNAFTMFLKNKKYLIGVTPGSFLNEITQNPETGPILTLSCTLYWSCLPATAIE